MERKPLTEISYRKELYINTAYVDIDVNGTTTGIDVDDFTAVVNVVIRMRDLMDLDNERLEWLFNTSKEILNEREVEVNVVEHWADQDVSLPILDFVYSALSDDEGVSQETWYALMPMLQALGCKSLMTAVGRNADGCDDRVFFPSRFEKKDLIAALRSVNKEEK